MHKVILIVSILLIAGMIGIVNAQQVLQGGGSSFETAVKLEPGSYQGGSIESRKAEYFYVIVKAGGEIQVRATYTAADIKNGAEAILGLYGEDKTPLIERVDGFYEEGGLITVSWVAGTAKDSYKCYIKVGSGIFKIASYLLDVSVKTPAEKEEKGGLNRALIIRIIARIIILAIIIYLLLKKKKNEKD